MDVAKWLSEHNKRAEAKKPTQRNSIERVDRYDREDMEAMRRSVPQYRVAREKLLDVVENTGGSLTEDATMSFYKYDPEVADPKTMDPHFLLNRAVIEQMLPTPEFQRLKSWTEGDLVNTAMAFVDIEEVLEQLHDKLSKQVQEAMEAAAAAQEALAQLQQQSTNLDDLIERWQQGGNLDPDELEAAQDARDALDDAIAAAQAAADEAGDEAEAKAGQAVKGMLPGLRSEMGEAADKQEQMGDMARGFGGDPGQLQRMSAQERINLAERFSRNRKFERLAELIGPMMRVAAAEQTRKVYHSFEEVYDVEIGSELARIVPSEMLDLLRPSSRLHFYQRWSEGKLLQYAMRGEEKAGKGGIIFCADEATEILTRNGWCRYDALNVNDDVLTLNHVTGVSEWQPVSRVTVFDAEPREVLSIEGRRHSSLTTLDHRWPLMTGRPDRTYKPVWRTSATIKSEDRIVTAAKCVNVPTVAKYEDALVELVAWLVADGTLLPGTAGARIYQSGTANAVNCATIRAALTATFGAAHVGDQRSIRGTAAWREDANADTGMVSFHLNAAAAAPLRSVMDDTKTVHAAFITALTASQLRLFIDTCVDADGDRAHGVLRYRQKVESRNQRFEMACALAGLPVSTKQRSVGDFESSVTQREDGALNVKAMRNEIVTHDGIVWCPTTPNTTWLARRNGTVYFTGNCMDNSGSMGGDRELWAKAVGLATLAVAREQKRSFHGLHFGSRSELAHFDFSTPDKITLDRVMDYAEFFFGGGPLRTDQRVVTPSGWKVIGEIEHGDYVFGPDGQPVGVTGVYPQGVLSGMYRVTFKDGAEVLCDATHLWTVKDRGPNGYNAGSRFTKTRTMRLSEIIDAGLNTVNGYRFSVPMTDAVEFPAADLPVDPYLLGYLLGNGGFTHSSPSVTPTPGDEHPWEPLLPAGVEAVQVESRAGFVESYLLTAGRRGSTRSNPLTETLRSLGLWGHDAQRKFIPADYLWGDVAQRWALLQGLCDSDGSFSKPGRLEYGTISERLAHDVVQLVQSLGGVATIGTASGRPNEQPFYRIAIILNGDDCPFRLARKVNQWQPRHHDYIRSIVSVEPIPDAECVCIKVDRQDGLFLTEGFVVTHNTDFVRPLSEALKLLQQEEKEKGFVEGDIVFVTDDACSVPQDWLAEFTKERERLGFKVRPILIGAATRNGIMAQIAGPETPVLTIQDLLSPEDVREMFREL